jgi:hypothetical protein
MCSGKLRERFLCQNTKPKFIEPSCLLSVVSKIIAIFLGTLQVDAHLVVPNRYALKVYFPQNVDADRAKAKFSRKTFTLTVTVPIS